MITLIDYCSHKKINWFASESGAQYWLTRYNMYVVEQFPRGYWIVRNIEPQQS
jgi:hypothetical protein